MDAYVTQIVVPSDQPEHHRRRATTCQMPLLCANAWAICRVIFRTTQIGAKTGSMCCSSGTRYKTDQWKLLVFNEGCQGHQSKQLRAGRPFMDPLPLGKQNWQKRMG